MADPSPYSKKAKVARGKRIVKAVQATNTRFALFWIAWANGDYVWGVAPRSFGDTWIIPPQNGNIVFKSTSSLSSNTLILPKTAIGKASNKDAAADEQNGTLRGHLDKWFQAWRQVEQECQSRLSTSSAPPRTTSLTEEIFPADCTAYIPDYNLYQMLAEDAGNVDAFRMACIPRLLQCKALELCPAIPSVILPGMEVPKRWLEMRCGMLVQARQSNVSHR